MVVPFRRLRARQQRNVTAYGSARWVRPRDFRAADLAAEAGVFLGRSTSHYLRHDGPEHVMAFAPTRCGKGVGLVVSTPRGWTGSTIVPTSRGENWQLTAGWRSRFSHCLFFNPTDARSARYNPLLEVRRGADEVRDVQNIADILVDPSVSGFVGSAEVTWWDNSGQQTQPLTAGEPLVLEGFLG